MTERFSFPCPPESDGERIDRVVADALPHIHRSQLRQRLQGLTRNGAPAKRATKVHTGDTISGTVLPPPPTDVTGEPIPLRVLAEEPGYIVIDKEQGMVVHPGAGNHTGTLVHALVWRYSGDRFFASATDDGDDDSGDPPRPGIVHRLDKDTSGVMIVARTPQIHAWLVEQFSSRTIHKEYLAIVKGVPSRRSGEIRAPLGRDPHNRIRFAVRGEAVLDGSGEPDVPAGARNATTAYRVLATYEGAYSLVRLHPTTGRTHQLRVHMQFLGHPILGDPLYARPDPRFPHARLMLHARMLELQPEPNASVRRFVAPPPERFRTILRSLRPDRDSTG